MTNWFANRIGRPTETMPVLLKVVLVCALLYLMVRQWNQDLARYFFGPSSRRA